VILHGYFRSSAAYRCRIAFNLKGLKPETRFVHLAKGEQRAAEFLSRNPHGLVPALEVDGRLLTQSIAIIEWLDETHPEPPLLPTEPFDRAHVRALALSIASDIHPLQNLRVLNHVRDSYGQDREGMFAWARHFIRTGLEALEQQIAASGSTGQFCFGRADHGRRLPRAANVLGGAIWRGDKRSYDIETHSRALRGAASLPGGAPFRPAGRGGLTAAPRPMT
jgi:maleylacetoacetate isomerase